jgi:hypothetical protein
MKKRSQPRVRLVPSAGGKPDDAGVRWSRVGRARERIAAGYYDREDVRERLLEAIVRELSER